MEHANQTTLTTLISISELFGNRLFQIPEYQRGYSWEEEHINDFLSDLMEFDQNDGMHYFGTIVLKNIDYNKKLYEVIDGQQRITTTQLLINAIIKKGNLNESAKESLKQQYIFRGSTLSGCLVISPHHIDVQDFYKNSIFSLSENNNRHPISKSENLLLDASTIFDKFIEDRRSDEKFILTILNSIQNKFGLLVYEPTSNYEVGVMFEVINNRGKHISELEKVKNFFIYFASVHNFSELKNQIDTNWSKILEYLNIADFTSNDKENSFLRNCFLVFFKSSKKESWNTFSELKERINISIKESKDKIEEKGLIIKNFTIFLVRASRFYALISNENFLKNDSLSKNKELLKVLSYLSCHFALGSTSSILPLYLSIMHKYEDNLEQLYMLLKCLEKLNFRVYMLPKVTKRVDTGQYKLIEFGYQLFQNDNLNESFDQCILNMKCFTIDHCSEEKLIQALTLDIDENDDYYNWNGIKYLLGRYEEKLQLEKHLDWDIMNVLRKIKSNRETSNSFLSIEHIWASKNRSQDFPIDDIQKRRLGNFVLLGLHSNITKSDKDIADKIEELRTEIKETQLPLQYLELANIYKFVIYKYKLNEKYKSKYYFKNLSTYINDNREKKLVDFAQDTWLFEEEKEYNFEIDSFSEKDSKIKSVFTLTEIDKPKNNFSL
jgi:uncharacterized protein with ParB-like and HNH nuclease domain